MSKSIVFVGFALAEVKKLIQIINELKEENGQLKTEIDELRQMIRLGRK